MCISIIRQQIYCFKQKRLNNIFAKFRTAMADKCVSEQQKVTIYNFTPNQVITCIQMTDGCGSRDKAEYTDVIHPFHKFDAQAEDFCRNSQRHIALA